MSDIMFTEYLKSFGLTGQEALIYEVLLKNAEMTGYEVSKETGISRSNVYSSLAGLVDKGAAYLIEGEPIRYLAVAVDKFCSHMLYQLEQRAAYLKAHAPEPKENHEGYITIQGSSHIREVIRDMLKGCKKRLYILAESALIKNYETELLALIAQNKKVVILTDNCEIAGALVYHTRPDTGQIRCIADSSYVLTGELRDRDGDTCLYSGQKNLVSVMKEALSNRIRLIELHEKDEIEKWDLLRQ